MTGGVTAAVTAAAIFGFALLPAAVRARPVAHANPRLLATIHLMGLVGWAILPSAALVCVGQGTARVLAGPGPGGGCWLGVSSLDWRLAAYGAATLALFPLVVQAVRVVVSVRRAGLPEWLRRRAEKHWASSGTPVWVVDDDHPAAYSVGVLRARAVVTTGALAPLDAAERQAVIEHEAAHVRRGHPGLLVLGGVVRQTYGFLPGVRRAWAGLCRELEAAADRDAARVVGTDALVSALARVTLAQQVTGTASFGDPEQLRYRLRRLADRSASAWLADSVVSLLVLAMLAAVGWLVCALLGAAPDPTGLTSCLVVGALVGSRPIWGWRSSVGHADQPPHSLPDLRICSNLAR